MSITNFFQKTISTKRYTNIGGSSKRQRLTTNLSGVSAAIHPVNIELFAVEGSAFYNSFKMFCTKNLDIKIGDKVIDGSDTYTVNGVADYDDLNGRNDEHMRLSLLKGK